MKKLIKYANLNGLKVYKLTFKGNKRKGFALVKPSNIGGCSYSGYEAVTIEPYYTSSEVFPAKWLVKCGGLMHAKNMSHAVKMLNKIFLEDNKWPNTFCSNTAPIN